MFPAFTSGWFTLKKFPCVFCPFFFFSFSRSFPLSPLLFFCVRVSKMFDFLSLSTAKDLDLPYYSFDLISKFFLFRSPPTRKDAPGPPSFDAKFLQQPPFSSPARLFPQFVHTPSQIGFVLVPPPGLTPPENPVLRQLVIVPSNILSK